jgi:hypothetical protein
MEICFSLAVALFLLVIFYGVIVAPLLGAFGITDTADSYAGCLVMVVIISIVIWALALLSAAGDLLHALGLG